MTGEARGGSRPEIEWDLLEPSLSSRDDFVGFERPFQPWTVIVVIVLCQPVLGALLLALNAWFLGLRRQIVPIVLGGVLLPGLVYLVALACLESPSENQAQVVRFLVRASGALWAAAFLVSHRRRFRLFLMCDGEPRSLWVAGIAFFVVAQVANPYIYSFILETAATLYRGLS